MNIEVFADWVELNGPLLIGTLKVARTKGHGVFSFQYDKHWLDKGLAHQLDPELHLLAGPQYLNNEKRNFGMFTDSAPDRWGRTLLDRKEAILARKEERRPRKLFEEDYLLGVYDLHRMGGLRFKIEGSDEFQNNDESMSASPWTSLRKLENASEQFENDLLKDNETLKWINMLIAPGASLGGARPKASVTDEKGNLWIAKFPSVNDKTDIGAWEMVAAKLAANCKIDLANSKLLRFNNKNHTFLSQRFDRQKNQRIHFASAMTLLGKTDGAGAATGNSYLDLAAFITQHGSSAPTDLEQLWRRIVFFIAIKNTDDHLRNHGFILNTNGWRLSPAYDINPVQFGTGLSLNISQDDNSLDFDLARSVAKYFRIEDQLSKQIITDTKKSVRAWPKYADQVGISKKEQVAMEPAFDLSFG